MRRFCLLALVLGCSSEVRRPEVSSQSLRIGVADDGDPVLAVGALVTDETGEGIDCTRGTLDVSIEASRSPDGPFVPLPSSLVTVRCLGPGAGRAVLVFDNSGSLNDVLPLIQSGAHAALDELRAIDAQVGLVRVSSQASVLSPLTRDVAQQDAAVDGMFVRRGWTALWDGVRVANEVLGGTIADVPTLSLDGEDLCAKDDVDAIILYSDGRENNSADEETDPAVGDGFDTTAEHLARLRVAGARTPIYTLGVGDQIDRDALASLARESGGRSFELATHADLAPALATVSSYLGRSYRTCVKLSNDTCGDYYLRVSTAWTDGDQVIHDQRVELLSLPCDEDAVCETAGDPLRLEGVVLDQAVDTARNGLAFDRARDGVGLAKSAARFESRMTSQPDKSQLACAADFDEDGWVDYVGGGPNVDAWLRLFRNVTYKNPAPADWDAVGAKRTIAFEASTTLASARKLGGGILGCEDVNGDGHADVVVARCADADGCIPTAADLYLGRGDGTFRARRSFLKNLSDLSNLGWSSTSVGFADVDADGDVDQIWGLVHPKGFGFVKVLLNDGADEPTFTPGKTLVSNLELGARGAAAIAVGDVDGDGTLDLLVGSPSSRTLSLYGDILNGSTNKQTITFAGGATLLLLADYDLDGRLDLLVGTDGWSLQGAAGGKAYLYRNDGDATPFSGGVWQDLDTSKAFKNTTPDFDMGFAADLDHDPAGTPDLLLADGNDSGDALILTNRMRSERLADGAGETAFLPLGVPQGGVLLNVHVAVESDPGDGTAAVEISFDDGETWTSGEPCPRGWCANAPRHGTGTVRARLSLAADPAKARGPVVHAVTFTPRYVRPESIAACLTTDVL